MKLCLKCKQPFEPEAYWQILCVNCCKLRDSEICFEALSLGEGSVECVWAQKGHEVPHKWEGRIGDCRVKIEWEKVS